MGILPSIGWGGGDIQRRAVIVSRFKTPKVPAEPLVDFGMSVGKSNAAGAIMPISWHIDQSGASGWIFRLISAASRREGRIVDAAWMFVQKHECFGRDCDDP